MGGRLTTVKFKPPACKRMLLRDRLLAAVDEQREKRLFILCAGAGYGKTILLAQLYDRQKRPAVWYSFDDPDKDPELFLITFVRAVKKTCPSDKVSTGKTASLTPGLPPDINLNNRYASFLNELSGSSLAPVALFFDDFQVINGSREITGFIQILINNMPDGCRVFIASRERPAISIGRLRAQRAVVEVRNQQMKFTLAETERFINPGYKKYLMKKELEELQSWSGGWPLALSRFRGELRKSGKKTAAVFSSQKLARAIDSYIATQTLNGIDNELKQLLMFSAVDHPITPAICDLVFSKRSGVRASSLLKTAEDLNLMIARSDEGESYEFHPRFRRYLINALQKNAARAEIISLHCKYADAYERQNEFARAIDHFIKGEAWDQATFLIETRGERMLAAGRVDELVRWLENIPVSVVSNRPWLKYIAAGVLARQGEVGEAGKKFISARNSFYRKGDKEGKFRCLIAESDLLARTGRARQGLRAAEEASRSAEKPEETAAAGCRIAINRLYLGAADNNADALGDTAVPAAPGTEFSASLKFAEAQTQLVRTYLAGDFKNLLADADNALSETKRFKDLEAQSQFSLEMTKALYLGGRYKDAFGAATESLALAHCLGDKLSEWTALGLRGCIRLYAGNPEGGTADIAEAVERFKTADINAPEFLNHLGNFYRRCGDAASAIEMHRLALEYGRSAQNPYTIAQSLANLVAHMLSAGKAKDPHKNTELVKSLRLALKHGYKYIEMQIYCHRSIYIYKLGDKSKALTQMQNALDLASHFEQNHFLAQEGKANQALFAFALEKGLHQEYLLKILGITGPEALPALAPLIKSRDPEVRRQAIAAVGVAGEREAIPYIRRCLKDVVDEVAEAADCELSRIRSGIKAPEEILSRRERQVFGLLAEGLSNVEIAKQLFIHEQTVKAHVGHIFDKLGMTKRFQAATYFRQ